MFHTLTLSAEYTRMKTDIADMYGSDVLYFAYDAGKYIGCYDSLDDITVSDTTVVYESINETSHRIY